MTPPKGGGFGRDNRNSNVPFRPNGTQNPPNNNYNNSPRGDQPNSHNAGPSNAGDNNSSHNNNNNRGGNSSGGSEPTHLAPFDLVPTGTMYSMPVPFHMNKLPGHDDKLAFFNYEAELAKQKPGKTTVPAAGSGTCQVYTNHLKVRAIPKEVHAYSIKYGRNASDQSATTDAIPETNDARPKHEKERIFDQIKPLFLADFYGWATDFDQIWSVRPLDEVDNSGELDEDENPVLTFTDVEYRSRSSKWAMLASISIVKTAVIPISDDGMSIKWDLESNIVNTRDAPTDDTSSRQSRIRALNALLLQHMRMETKGANHQVSTVLRKTTVFFTEAWQPRSSLRLCFPRSYTVSLRPIQKSEPMVLNVNLINTAFLYPSTVADLFLRAVVNGPLSPHELKELLFGKQLRLMYRRGADAITDPRVEGERIVLFQGFGEPTGTQITHWAEKGADGKPDVKHATVYDYYNRRLPNLDPSMYQHAALLSESALASVEGFQSDEKMPTVCIRRWRYNPKGEKQSVKAETHVPAHLVEIVPFQAISRVLPPALTEHMIAYAVRSPALNLSLIVKEGLRDLGIQNPHFIQRLTQISIEPCLMKLGASRLDVPVIKYSGKEIKVRAETAAWNLAERTNFLQPKVINKLHIISLTNNNHRSWNKKAFDAERIDAGFASAFAGKFDDHGLWTKTSTTVVHKTCNLVNNNVSWQQQIVAHVKGLFSEGMPDIDLECFLFLLPGANRSKERNIYAAIKTATDRILGIRTAVCALPPMGGQGIDEQRISNIALKFNFRRCGQVHNPVGSKIETQLKNTVILGADVTHPSNADPDKGSPSMAALVGTLSTDVTNYGGSMRLQRGRREDIADMKGMAIERLRGYAKKTGNLPRDILMYRDGVGEEAMDKIYRAERTAILDAWDTVANNPNATKPKLTYIIVTKRHNTRFYPVQEKDAIHGNGNLRAGLIVDHSITPQDPPNFYLQSHHAIQGTARSAHYTVMEDGMGLKKAGILYNVTHTLCYAFARATKGVSYAAPAYVADRLCERGNVYLRLWNASADKIWSAPGIDPGPRADQHILGVPTTLPSRFSQLDDQQKDVVTNAWATDKNKWCNYVRDLNHNAPNPWHLRLDDFMFWM